MKHKTQKQSKPNIVKTHHYNCAYVRLTAVLIIFPVIIQTVINLIMLSIGGQGAINNLTWAQNDHRKLDQYDNTKSTMGGLASSLAVNFARDGFR